MEGIPSAASRIAICGLYIASIIILVLPWPSSSSVQRFQISPVFRASQMYWIDNDGRFLLSNSSNFAFGFTTFSSTNTTFFLLVVIHQSSSTVVWTANRASPVTHSDDFVFDRDGNAYLQSGETVIWSTNTSGMGAASMELRDSGNLVVLGANRSAPPLWQSFSHPTDTILSGQSFAEGMMLVSNPNSHNLVCRLKMEAGDMMLYADFRQPQPYWSMQGEKRKIYNTPGGAMHSASLVSGSWNFYDKNQSLLWQFVISGEPNVTWAVVLGEDGFISFRSLPDGGGSSGTTSSTKIPLDSCDTPEPCDPYFICYRGTRCQCPAVLSSDANCNPDLASLCSSSSSDESSSSSLDLAKVEDGIGYFATGYVSPVTSKSNLTACRGACMGNCSCLALLFDEKSGDCFLFDEIGSFQQSDSGYSAYIKISVNGGGGGGGPNSSGGGGGNNSVIIIVISLTTAVVIAALIYAAYRIVQRRRKKPLAAEPPSPCSSEENSFLENISGMPIRFAYRDLLAATNNFSVKLGQGGFGSVYLGNLADGTQIAVKKLESIGQGKKEFRAEVSIIGSIHHVHLVRLRGFCAEGTHRLLAYEYMPKNSLDRWIFRTDKDGSALLDWDRRYSIALGTAKGLAYLHEDCDSKIVHCDIKPENVLLDDNFVAKVSDFGLAKLMTREQSHVFTTLRGTRGYLAPEWLTNYAISEKSDVYSFGMVLLEIIGGRKSYDPAQTSEKAHFPSYAFKKVEEGRIRDVLDERLLLLKINNNNNNNNNNKEVDDDYRVEIAVKVALWCIQEDMSLRPSMGKVVQMLEGVAEVPPPPTSSQMAFRLYANVFKPLTSTSEEGTSSGPSDCNSDALLSAVRLSGPR
ncbi:hypothetical protein J5N97_013240 [Dioscorea zingiberensis]|uniref:Receptor-like serine/threonine-protein kinase n=1 Tax=Dioscorea zingiberensis TaxID=325984 RepID=A0A9D5CQ97_9LILI|nr:hypothetical protein J5N97_013240 [Dioscorea zingiberensis]